MLVVMCLEWVEWVGVTICPEWVGVMMCPEWVLCVGS